MSGETMTCPVCGRESKMRGSFSLYAHGPGQACNGGDDLFSELLAAAGLDVRVAGDDTGTPWEPHPGNRTAYQQARSLSPLARRVFVALQLRPQGITGWDMWALYSGIPEDKLQAGSAELIKHGLVRQATN